MNLAHAHAVVTRPIFTLPLGMRLYQQADTIGCRPHAGIDPTLND